MATPLRRYGAGARWCDVLSGERWVYGAGRAAGIELFAPSRGDIVVDLGCGTGLNFPALAAAVGREGLVVGVDRSAEMLAMARRRVADRGWGIGSRSSSPTPWSSTRPGCALCCGQSGIATSQTDSSRPTP